MLNQRQKQYFDFFIKCIENNNSKLLDSTQRMWGKSTIINELGLDLQALGYYVIVLTKHPQSNEYYCNLKIINHEELFLRTRGLRNVVVLIDEYLNYKLVENNIIYKLGILKIPVVGFVNFRERRE